MKLTPQERIKKQHIAIMRDPDFCLYSGVIMLGKVEIADDVPTAYTDGLNVKYGTKFIEGLSDKQLAGLILHENLHKALRHMTTCQTLWAENARLANIAADFVVNQIIKDSDKHGRLVELPPGALQDDKYKGMSVLQVYESLKDEHGGGGGGGGCEGEPTDEHGFDKAKELSAEEKREVERQIDEALRQGEQLSRKLGGKKNRAIEDLLNPKVNWKEALREFISNIISGKDDYTWRKIDKRYSMDDLYVPTTMSETVGEIVVAIDTSGSIGIRELTEFASELGSICTSVNPERVRILWWDTAVHGEQVFTEESYGAIHKLLKPQGGGGTDARCVVDYLQQQSYRPECVIMFTDGYLDQVTGFNSPVLWMVTQNKNWEPSEGFKVDFE